MLMRRMVLLGFFHAMASVRIPSRCSGQQLSHRLLKLALTVDEELA
jgi:hypothetical protein